jgi:hypothetical protein
MAYQRSIAYQPGQTSPVKLSRSKIELFEQYARCFWLGERLKIKRPSGPPFNINKAIDELFKKEFDAHRAEKTAHPLMVEYKLDAVPFPHKDLDMWRENFVGVQALDKASNILVFGAVDDVWVRPDGELIVVDYKATAKDREVNINSDWQMSYKRQLEVYQWLLRKNGFKVSDTGYFVYTNVNVAADGFADTLTFKTKLIPYEGSTSWVEPTLLKMKACLEGDMPPVGQAAMGGECDFCLYAKSRTELTLKHITSANNITKKK